MARLPPLDGGFSPLLAFGFILSKRYHWWFATWGGDWKYQKCWSLNFKKVSSWSSKKRHFKIFHNNVFIFQPCTGVEKVFEKFAFLMIFLRKYKSISKVIISLNSPHSGGHFDILKLFCTSTFKKVFMFFQKLVAIFEKF